MSLKDYIRFKYHSFRKKTIPDKDHVARYLRPSDIDDSTVISTGFEYKKNKENGALKERELSVNWLEFYSKNGTFDDNVESVREAFRQKGYTPAKNGKFAVLNVKRMRDEVKEGTLEYEKLVSLMVQHTPNVDDLSHSSIFGIPFDADGELLVSAILANHVNETQLFPARA